METDSRDLMERRHEAKRQLTPWVLPRHLQTHAELLPSVNRQKITTCVLHYTTMTNRSCSHLQTHAELLPSVNRQNNHLHPHNTTMTNHSCSHLQTHAELLPPVNRQKITTCIFHYTTMTNTAAPTCKHMQSYFPQSTDKITTCILHSTTMTNTAAHNCSKIQEENHFTFQLQYFHLGLTDTHNSETERDPECSSRISTQGS